MHILSLSNIPLLSHLGSGKTRIYWTNGLQQMGNTVDCLTPIDFELFPNMSRGKKFRQAIGVLLTARKKIKNKQYDIIEFYGDEYWLLLLWLRYFVKKVPLLVAHADGVELLDMQKEQLFWNKRKGITYWLFKQTHYRFSTITFRLANTLVCGCLDDLNYVIQQKLFHSLYAECIAPGIEENFHQIPFQAIKEKAIIYIGSWIPRKGIQLIPAVIHTILKNNATYEFRVFGAWDSKLEILEQFDLNVRNRVKVFDKLSSNLLVSEITKAAIFFFPTYSEGFGLATVEAMCCSCAVVTTPTGIGCNLINNKQALICDFNDISAMQAAIQTLIDDELFRQEIALGGYSKAKSFNWQTQIEKLHTTYKKWLHLFAANV